MIATAAFDSAPARAFSLMRLHGREGVLTIPAVSEAMTAEPNATGEPELRRDLRRPHVLAIVVGAVVGTGIYIRPASIARGSIEVLTAAVLISAGIPIFVAAERRSRASART